ncbi:MAG: DHHA1 domain-containing protein [Thermofilum sp.]|nr:DHHA1 domain-containing protein [Thermofilum sp.]
MVESALRVLYVVAAKLLRRKLGLADAGDPDGVVSAALFKRRYPSGLVVLAYPSSVQRNPLYRLVKWDFVADLPCPGRVRVYADHHVTNRPCAEKSFHDPSAPAAALLALEALGLSGDPEARRLAELAVETDTASITSREAELLEAAVKGASYLEKLRLVNSLARMGVRALEETAARLAAERYSERKRRTEEFLEKLPPERVIVVFFERDLGLSHRYLTILLERRGSEFAALIVPRNPFTYRVYLGAQRGSSFDASLLAKALGGGGHAFAAGAMVRGLGPARVRERILALLREIYRLDSVPVYLVDRGGRVSRLHSDAAARRAPSF